MRFILALILSLLSGEAARSLRDVAVVNASALCVNDAISFDSFLLHAVEKSNPRATHAPCRLDRLCDQSKTAAADRG